MQGSKEHPRDLLEVARAILHNTYYVPRCCYSCDLREAIAAEEARRERAAALPPNALEEAASAFYDAISDPDCPVRLPDQLYLKLAALETARNAEEARRAREAALPADALEEAVLAMLAAFDPSHPGACPQECFDESSGHGREMQDMAIHEAQSALAASRARRAEMRPVRRLVRCPGCGFADENGIGVFCHEHEPPIPMVHYVEERRS